MNRNKKKDKKFIRLMYLGYEDGIGIASYVFVLAIMLGGFLIGWNGSLELNQISSIEDIDIYSKITWSLVYHIMIIIITKRLLFINHKDARNFKSIINIIPMKKEDIYKPRVLSIFIIAGYFIGPYIAMFLFRPSTNLMIATRGMVIVFMIITLILLTKRNLYRFQKNKEKYIKNMDILFWVYMLVIILFYVALNYYSMFPIIKSVVDTSHNCLLLNFIGNTYVGIILGLITSYIFYKINYVYVIDKLKSMDWEIG
ncbi:hypothetical protein ACQPU1_04240 [Clostridium paraputrificum]|uniref:hypothetical protein n=1 Tax=Clostridium TaxID=1485 RepID=UPI003D351050